MPIEIKELHIKATVVDRKAQQLISSADMRKEQEKMKREVMKECIREILEIFDDRSER